MKFKVNNFNNFCRVFELPDEYPHGFCFGNGSPITFKMVDWFNPVDGNKEISYAELYETLVPWLRKKTYVQKNKEYLVMCDFGASITFKS